MEEFQNMDLNFEDYNTSESESDQSKISESDSYKPDNFYRRYKKKQSTTKSSIKKKNSEVNQKVTHAESNSTYSQETHGAGRVSDVLLGEGRCKILQAIPQWGSDTVRLLQKLVDVSGIHNLPMSSPQSEDESTIVEDPETTTHTQRSKQINISFAAKPSTSKDQQQSRNFPNTELNLFTNQHNPTEDMGLYQRKHPNRRC